MWNNTFIPEQLAHYLLDNHTNIRQTAKHFGSSKSAVHYQLNINLKRANYPLYKKVKALLKYNFDTKHIRGGMATKKKYEKLKDTKMNKTNFDTSNNFY